MAELTVEAVAADRKVWSGTATQVSARGIDGDLGILPGHEPLLTVLAAGPVTIKCTDGTVLTATIDEGFMSVDRDVVTLVAQHVETSA